MNDNVSLHNAAEVSPLVSMVIPCYNHASYVQESIASVIAQDYENIELIIIDDGSQDESVEMIKAMVARCRDRFVRFEFRARENSGLSTTLNEALEWAKGEYFAALASDDVLLPSKTSLLVACLKDEAGVAGAFGGAEAVNVKGSVVKIYESPDTVCDFEDVLLHKVIVNAPAQLLNTNAVKAVGGFKAGMYIEDWYLWLKLTNSGYRLKFINHIVVKYRLHASNISKNIEKMHESRLEILKDYQNHPSIRFAEAQVYAACALEYAASSPSKAIHNLFASFKASSKAIFTYNFIYACIKIITPVFLLNPVKKLIRVFKHR